MVLRVWNPRGFYGLIRVASETETVHRSCSLQHIQNWHIEDTIGTNGVCAKLLLVSFSAKSLFFFFVNIEFSLFFHYLTEKVAYLMLKVKVFHIFK